MIPSSEMWNDGWICLLCTYTCLPGGVLGLFVPHPSSQQKKQNRKEIKAKPPISRLKFTCHKLSLPVLLRTVRILETTIILQNKSSSSNNNNTLNKSNRLQHSTVHNLPTWNVKVPDNQPSLTTYRNTSWSLGNRNTIHCTLYSYKHLT